MKTKLCLITLIILAMTGCQQKLQPDVPAGPVPETPCIFFKVCPPEENHNGRSHISVNDSKISDLNIFVYSNGTLLGEQYIIGQQTGSMEIAYRESYTYYVIANAGKDITAPSDEEEIKAYSYRLTDMDSINGTGFPMAQSGSFHAADLGSEITVELERLVARIDFGINTEDCPGLHVKSVQLKNSPCDITPFTSSSAAMTVMPGDQATPNDIESINAGKRASFYMLENCQGVLLPNNKDQSKKVPENIPGNKAKLCTYIEVSATLDGAFGVEGPLTYRFYLGQDETTDFNIYRNTVNKITLTATKDGVNEVSWRVDNSSLTQVSVPIIAAGTGGHVFYTEENNKHVTLTVGTNDWNCITYGKNKYVIGGSEGNIIYSTDGKSWKTAHAGTCDWKGIAYGNGKFVMVGTDGCMAYSTNGITWSTTQTESCTWNAVTYGEGLFVAVGKINSYIGAIAYSSDGINWEMKSSTQYAYTMNTITFGNGRFVALGKANSGIGKGGWSEDGKNWTIVNAGVGIHYCVTYGNGKFLAIARNEIIFSENGEKWDYENLFSSYIFEAVSYGNGKFAATGYFAHNAMESRIMYSTNGKNWNLLTDLTDVKLNTIYVIQ